MKLTDNIIGGKNVRCMIPACDWTGKYTTGVFGMEHHLQSNHKAIWESRINDNKEFESFEENKSLKDSISKKVLISDYMAPPWESEDYLMAHCALFLYLASYGRPFSMAYNDRTSTNPFNTNKINGPIGFNALLYLLTHGAYAAPCREVLTKLLDVCPCITKSFIKELIISASKFYNYLPFLHLSSDLWTSKFTNESFGTIHVHFCGPEGNFEHFCLGVTAIHGSHTSNLLESWITNCLDEFSISKTWIISAVADGAKNIQTALSSAGLPVKKCIAHTFSLCVKTASGQYHCRRFNQKNKRSQNEFMEAFANRVRKVITHFKHSSKATDSLILVQDSNGVPDPKKLQSEVITRWSSMWIAWSRIIVLFKYLTEYANSQDGNRDSFKDWLTMEDEQLLLQYAVPLYHCNIFQKWIQGMSYTTASQWYLRLHLLKRILQKKDQICEFGNPEKLNTKIGQLHPQVKEFKNILIEELNNRFPESSLDNTDIETFLLDPTVKDICHLFVSQDEINSAWMRLNEEALKLENAENQIDISNKRRKVDSTDIDDILDQDLVDAQMDIRSIHTQLYDISNNEVYSNEEVNSYRNSTGIRFLQSSDFDMRKFWFAKHKADAKSVLSKMALRRACKHASTVDAEGSFSVAGIILDKKRAKLDTLRFEKLMNLYLNRRILPSPWYLSKQYQEQKNCSFFSINKSKQKIEEKTSVDIVYSFDNNSNNQMLRLFGIRPCRACNGYYLFY